jgi:hypothetical protein
MSSPDLDKRASFHLRVFTFTLFALLTACMSSKPPSEVYRVPEMSDEQWERTKLECRYEADKAVASQKPGPARHEAWKGIFLTCLDLRGVKYLGTSDQFPQLKQ